jgi:excisionase family DNA binding protein
MKRINVDMTDIFGENRSLLTIEQVAQRLGVNVRHVRRLVAERRIPYTKWGKLLRFDSAAIEQWIDSCTVEAKHGA